MGIFSHDDDMFEPDWDKINKEREIAKKLLEEKFLDEDNGDYEIIDYFSPPDDEADQIKATCDFCNAKVVADPEEMTEHFLGNHMDKVELVTK